MQAINDFYITIILKFYILKIEKNFFILNLTRINNIYSKILKDNSSFLKKLQDK